MSPIGGGKPLFDLIPKDRHADTSSARADTEGGAAPPAEQASPLTGSLVIPVVWVYAGFAALIVLVVVMYGLAYRLGVSSERERWREQASADARDVFVSDPLRGAEGDRDGSQSTGSQIPGGGSSRGERLSDPEDSVSGASPVLTATGFIDQDPRVSGSNYLELATLPRDWAEAAVRYLADQGIDAIAVPQGRGVDRRGGRSNTSGSYRVIATELAVPGEQYSALKPERDRLVGRVKRVGKAWAESGGASDFSDPLWRRHGG